MNSYVGQQRRWFAASSRAKQVREELEAPKGGAGCREPSSATRASFKALPRATAAQEQSDTILGALRVSVNNWREGIARVAGMRADGACTKNGRAI